MHVNTLRTGSAHKAMLLIPQQDLINQAVEILSSTGILHFVYADHDFKSIVVNIEDVSMAQTILNKHILGVLDDTITQENLVTVVINKVQRAIELLTYSGIPSWIGNNCLYVRKKDTDDVRTCLSSCPYI